MYCSVIMDYLERRTKQVLLLTLRSGLAEHKKNITEVGQLCGRLYKDYG